MRERGSVGEGVEEGSSALICTPSSFLSLSLFHPFSYAFTVVPLIISLSLFSPFLCLHIFPLLLPLFLSPSLRLHPHPTLSSPLPIFR